jgi:polyhydroxybutyrate depolymerase
MLGWFLLGCHPARDCGAEPPIAGEVASCALPDGRRYDAVLPTATGPLPVVLAIHGGGGNSRNARTITCPTGDLDDADCLDALGVREGFLTIYPDGTPSTLLRNLKTWNAGGGVDDLQCTSGRACADNVDDVGYFRSVLDDLSRWVTVDERRVYATGLSNGGAMSYRLGHELSDRIAAIAPIGAADQFGIASEPPPADHLVPVLDIHGTADPCWPFDGGTAACLQDDGKRKVGVPETIARLVAERGCAPDAVSEAIPDVTGDGTASRFDRFSGCSADVIQLRIEGGGHTWPDGDQYLSESRVGLVERDFIGNEVIWAFFRDHPMPE